MSAPRILIVDDDRCTRAVINATLAKLGYQTRTADDGRAALALHDAHPADLVITDIFMPEMDGIELIMALRRQRDAPKIVAVSGGGVLCGGDVLEMATMLGADAAVEKPLRLLGLVRTVNDLLEARFSSAGRSASRSSRLAA